MKDVGEPCAGEPHARFDGRGLETERDRVTAPAPDPTILVPFWYIDTGFTALLTLLAVVDEGLGALFFGIAPQIMAGFREAYGVPEEWTPIGAIAIGHPDPDAAPIARVTARKSLDELVHRGHW